jgi:hypothetical protein
MNFMATTLPDADHGGNEERGHRQHIAPGPRPDCTQIDLALGHGRRAAVAQASDLP